VAADGAGQALHQKPASAMATATTGTISWCERPPFVLIPTTSTTILGKGDTIGDRPQHHAAAGRGGAEPLSQPSGHLAACHQAFRSH
jgi:hypothetical protein